MPRTQSDWWQGGGSFLARFLCTSCCSTLVAGSDGPAAAVCSRALSARVATFTTRSLGEGDSLAEEVRHLSIVALHACAPEVCVLVTARPPHEKFAYYMPCQRAAWARATPWLRR